MKKRTKSFLLASALSLMVGTCAFAGVNALAEATQKIGLYGSIAETASIGEVVTLPDYYAEINGYAEKATANVITPSGTVYEGTKFTASEGGKYVIEYTVNGEVVYTHTCLAVISSTDLFQVNALGKVDGLANYKYKEDDDSLKGVAVNVQSGATITFDREIEMTSLTKDDILFRATVEPTEKGEADFRQMVLTFTDTTDDSIYFRMTISDGHADGASPKHMVYVNGAANGQTAGGMNYERGTPYFQFKDIYGTSTPSSFRAETYGSINYSLYAITLFYESSENAVYVTTYEDQKILVVDFDDPLIFGGNVWSGFKSGKAKLTVSFLDATDKGRVIFNEVGGLNLSQETVVDTVAPDIFVDLGGETKAPNALLGTEYTIFPCVAKDFFDYNVQVDATVYYENAYTGVKTDVMVKDGKFITDKLGTYTIRYTATDYTGNQSSKELSFECIANAEKIVLTGVPAPFSAKAFEKIDLPALSSIRAFGGNGSLKISVTAIDPDGEESALDNDSFIPRKIGEYKIVYTATDYYGVSESVDLLIQSLENENTTFMNEIVLPDLLIAGFTYTIPEVEAYACRDGGVIECDMEYLVNGVKLGVDRAFVANAEMQTTTVVCRATFGGETYGEISKQVLIIDGNHGRNQAAYFYDKTDRVQVTETQETIDLSASTDSSVSFVNKLNASAFALGVNYDWKQCKFTSFKVTLADAEKSDVTVSFRFSFTQDGVKITDSFGVTTDFPSDEGYFKMNFNCDSGIVSDANNLGVTFVDKDDKGNDFNGFTSGLYATFAFEGVEAESSISLVWLNNQLLGFHGETDEEIADTRGPEIQTNGEIPVKVKRGEAITLYSATATDVLSQVVSMTVRFVSPDGKDIVAERTADENISATLTETGTYRVYYVAHDSEGNRTRVGQNIRVVDSVAPTLEVNFSDMTTSVGKTITLPKVTVSDDSGKVFYDIFLSLPNSEMRLLYHYDNGQITSYLEKNVTRYPTHFKVSADKFKVEQKGKYVLTVMAYDEEYNVTMQSFTITVK